MPPPEKRSINAKEVLRDIQAGMSDLGLMDKYRLSPKGLESLKRKLDQAGLLKQSPENAPSLPVEQGKPKSWTCPACQRSFNEEHDECPACGVVVSRYRERGLADDDYRMPPTGSRMSRERRFPEPDEWESEKEAPGQDLKLIFGGLGGIALLFGTFAPIVKLPVIGGLSYFQVGKAIEGVAVGGYILVALAAAALLLVFLRSYVWLWATGAAAYILLIYTYLRFRRAVSEFADQVKTQFDAMPAQNIPQQVDIGALAGQLQQAIQMDWGWIVLAIGAGLMLASAFIATREALAE